jgi:hypothetical protein
MSGSSSPGATSHNTGSSTPVNGNSYMVALVTMRGTSLDPDQATISGWGQTWTELTNLGRVWSTSGTVHRRVQFFCCRVASGSTGSLTFSWTNTPDIVDWAICNLGVTGNPVFIAGTERRSPLNDTIAEATLLELSAFAAVTGANNRWWAFGTGNVNATTLRLELNTDGGGEEDWQTIATFGSGSSRARKSCWGYRDVTDDNQVGFFLSTTGPASFSGFAVEINYAITYEGTMNASPDLAGAQMNATVIHEATMNATPPVAGGQLNGVVQKNATMNAALGQLNAQINGTVNGGGSGIIREDLNPWIGIWIGL